MDQRVDIKELEKTIRGNIDIKGDSILSATRCIFRVPEVLRRNNTKAYEPDMVAIGPLHDRKQEKYQYMEKAKRWYLREYILSSKNVDLAELIEVVTGDETLARDCYAESLDSIEPSEFIEMMILDGCFIVELFRRFCFKKQMRNDGSQPEEDDPILSSQPKEDDPILTMDCMLQYICHDLLLLENQLPWVVLQNLYSHTQGKHDYSGVSLSELIFRVFSFLPSVGNNYNFEAYQNYLCFREEAAVNHKHVLDLFRTSIVHSFDAPERFLEITYWLMRAEKDIKKEIHSATTLSKLGGVKFKRGFHGGRSIMSMGFKEGVLTIPEIVIGDLSEPLFRNLIAFEQCYRSHSHKITSYAAVMGKLISSKEDMDLLCKKKIIRNWLSAEDGFKFFSKLSNDTYLETFYYEELCTEVNGYLSITLVRWIQKLRLTVISLFGVTILLVLTILQTIFTIRG